MAGEIVYADLKIPLEHQASSLFHPTRQLNAPQNPRCHQITLWVACFGTVILVAAVIALVLLLEAEKRKTGLGCGPVKLNCSSDSSRSLLRSRLCNQSQDISSVNSTCQICPPHWYFHQGKCYWPSKNLKSWRKSQNDCSEKRSHLAVIQNKEELEFLKKFTEDAQIYWIGFSISSSVKKLVWITGHKFDQNLFQAPPISDGGDNCGGIKNGKIMTDICTAVLKWVCQQDAMLL